MMVLRLNTLMVLAVAADECMCQLFPVRGGDGNLKFAANDDGSCIAEKLFKAPRLEADEELIVRDLNVLQQLESLKERELTSSEAQAQLQRSLDETYRYLEQNVTNAQEAREIALEAKLRLMEDAERAEAAALDAKFGEFDARMALNRDETTLRLDAVADAIVDANEAQHAAFEEKTREWDEMFTAAEEARAEKDAEVAKEINATFAAMESVRMRCVKACLARLSFVQLKSRI